MRTTGAAPIASSPGANVRPTTGRTPSSLEQVRGDQLAAHPLRVAEAGEDEGEAAIDGHRREDMVVTVPVEEVRIRDRAGGEIRLALVDADEPIGMGIGQRIEEDAVHDREQGGIRADAEGERQDGHQRETRGPDEGANGVAQILEQCGHQQSPQPLAAGRPGLKRTACHTPARARLETALHSGHAVVGKDRRTRSAVRSRDCASHGRAVASRVTGAARRHPC